MSYEEIGEIEMTNKLEKPLLNKKNRKRNTLDLFSNVDEAFKFYEETTDVIFFFKMLIPLVKELKGNVRC